MDNKHQRLAALACILSLVVAGILWFGRTHESPAGEAARASNQVAKAQRVHDTPAAPSDYPASEPPLPPEFELLRQRAEAGDHRAACQLGVKLIYCASVAINGRVDLQEKSRTFEQKFAEAGDLELANSYANAQLASIVARRTCGDIPADVGHAGHAWVRHAALAGEPDAMLMHASGSTLVTSIDDGWTFLRDGRFQQWRAESPDMLQTLLESGDPAAVVALLYGFDNRGYQGWITRPDPDRALVLTLLAGELFTSTGNLPSPGFRRPMDRMLYREARERAREWHRDYFDGKTVELAPHVERIANPTGFGNSLLEPTRACGAQWRTP